MVSNLRKKLKALGLTDEQAAIAEELGEQLNAMPAPVRVMVVGAINEALSAGLPVEAAIQIMSDAEADALRLYEAAQRNLGHED